MSAMEKKYLMTRMDGRIFSFLLNDRRAVEIHCDAGQAGYVIGNIYVGKIKNIAKNIGAAFVEIAPGNVCHLALDDIRSPFYVKKGASKLPQAGDELLVQIMREGIKTKRPSVTTNLSLHGKYVLLTTGNTVNAVSSKLAKPERTRLLALAERFEKVQAEGEGPMPGMQSESGGPLPVTQAEGGGPLPASQAEDRGPIFRTQMEDNGQKVAEHMGNIDRPYGWLFRTNAGGTAEELLFRDMETLRQEYQTLLAQARYRTCFSCVYEMPAAHLLRLSNLYDSEAEEIVTDDEELYRGIESYLRLHQPEDLGKLRLYRDPLLPLQKLYSLEHQLEQALQERVWLESGGYLVIQPTEALTVIDVNTGKFEGGKEREAAFLKINREAAVEIARQLRLRNISGIIIVDFINMEEDSSKETLLSVLDAELRRDPIRTTLVDMTKLSLVEITRQKRERPLAECIG